MKLVENMDIPELELKIAEAKKNVSEELFNKMKLCCFKSGEYIFREGEKSDSLFIILKGVCKVFKTLENGKTILLCLYEDIQVLGEFEIFGDPIVKTNIQALQDTYCFVLPVSPNRKLLLSDNSFLQFVCRKVCSKIERNNKNTGINLLYPLEQRLAGYLLIMQSDGMFSSNYTMLAEYLGCSHRHLLRTFRLLCEKGLLEKRGTSYLLKDISALEKFAGGVYQ